MAIVAINASMHVREKTMPSVNKHVMEYDGMNTV